MAWYEDFNKAAAYTVKLSNLEITFHGLQNHRSRGTAGLQTGWQAIFVQNLRCSTSQLTRYNLLPRSCPPAVVRPQLFLWLMTLVSSRMREKYLYLASISVSVTVQPSSIGTQKRLAIGRDQIKC